MRHFLIIITVALLFSGCSGGREQTPLPARNEQELLTSFLAMHQKKDLDGIVGLFYLKDTPTFVVDSLKKRTMKNFAYTISSAQIEEIPPEKLKTVMAGVTFNGKTLVPNLQPLKQIAIKFAQSGQSEELRAAGGSIMFGKVGNTCFFVLAKEKGAGAK